MQKCRLTKKASDCRNSGEGQVKFLRVRYRMHSPLAKARLSGLVLRRGFLLRCALKRSGIAENGTAKNIALPFRSSDQFKKYEKPLAFCIPECYNNAVIDNGVIEFAGGEGMANKDHSLDSGIARAAYEEFLSCGFRKASLHKIAENAGVTTGAIYTRYRNKDALFVSLLQGFLETLEEVFSPAAEEYERARESARTEDIIRAINAEEEIYFRLLTEHYDDCVLFFSCSDGSSVETMLNDLMEQKTQQTVDFFFRVYGKKPNADAIRLIMGSQFWHFRQLLDKHRDEDRMFACLRSILDFTNAGWRQLCLTLQ